MHLALYDTVNASFVFERAQENFGENGIKGTSLNKLKIIADQLQEFEFGEALKSVDGLGKNFSHLKNMLCYFQIPKILRQTHSTIAK